ncbi:GGDEF domain-containing protein [Vibrio viridaestus]|uniref:diguanylate cyclase n=1 Tax=Vibrio viridaestus TaxID=2487322 RepID=A0A3N9TKL9_9VIBR|nr:GGDEF domain-containing protein [Vibrio viridaestus]RQW64889.1 GGDEF domain-containing protein [Vibrio viridaestus]
MKNDIDIKNSNQIFKQAVPLMVKNKVAPSPQNYALWYSYVENIDKDLCREIDATISKLGYCPPSVCDDLYDRFVASRSEADLKSLRKDIEIMLLELSTSMFDASNDTQKFSLMLDKSFKQLEIAEKQSLSLDEVMSLVRQLVTESREIRQSTQFLNERLNSAGQEIDKLKEQLIVLQSTALNDSLTGVHNRRAFDHDLKTMVEGQIPFCLIFTDIDHFKSLNDRFGHLFGDSVLKAVAKRLETPDSNYSVYRYGGEEFAIIAPNRPLRSARQLADALRRGIEKLKIKDRKSGESVNSITASFGVVEHNATQSLDQTLSKADELLYQAKKLGRNRVMPL